MISSRRPTALSLLLTAGLIPCVIACGEDPPASPDAAPTVAPPPPDAGQAARTVDALVLAPEPPPSPYQTFDGKLGQGQTLTASLAPVGVSSAQVAAIVNTLKEEYSFRRARPGSPWSVTLRREDGRLESFRFEHGALEIYEVVRDESDKLVGRQAEVKTRTEVIEAGAEIKSSLYNAMQRAGEEPGLVALVTDVFAWDLDFYKDTRPGDRFRVVVEKIFKEDEFVRYGRILAAEYAGSKGTFATFWFEPSGLPGDYYLEDGRSARKTFLATPLKFARVSSSFGRRKHPVLGYTRQHNGVDYAAPTGTPVWAMASGTVTFAARKGPSGNLIRIDHHNGLTSAYAHLHRFAKGIKRGVKVSQKQIIGYVGTTGRSTGPHLHFGVKRKGRWINPRSLKMTRGRPVAKKHRAAFKAMIAARKSRLEKIALDPIPTAPAASETPTETPTEAPAAAQPTEQAPEATP